MKLQAALHVPFLSSNQAWMMASRRRIRRFSKFLPPSRREVIISLWPRRSPPPFRIPSPPLPLPPPPRRTSPLPAVTGRTARRTARLVDLLATRGSAGTQIEEEGMMRRMEARNRLSWRLTFRWMSAILFTTPSSTETFDASLMCLDRNKSLSELWYVRSKFVRVHHRLFVHFVYE